MKKLKCLSIYKSLAFWKICILSTLILSISCNKEKLDMGFDNRPDKENDEGSTIRLVNLDDYTTELVVNGDSLTSFHPKPASGNDIPVATKYFPETGRLSRTYSIPQDLLGNGKDQETKINFAQRNGQISRPFIVKNNGNFPVDYYYLPYKPHEKGFKDSLFRIPREITAASNPRNFRIRILNLGSEPDRFGPMGTVNLTFADGTEVHNKLKDIAVGKYSEYIELPWGTYQFKLYNQQGKPIPANKSESNAFNSTSINSVNLPMGIEDSYLIAAPIKTYQPGGVYTIVVGNAEITYNTSSSLFYVSQNSFSIINDVAEPFNRQAKVQIANVLPGMEEIKVSIGGTELLGNLSFGQVSADQLLFSGNTEVIIKGTDDKELVKHTLNLKAADNITLWVYADNTGKPMITAVANNLSGSRYAADNVKEQGSDGSFNQLKNNYPFFIRFINFSPDLEEITFTRKNGQPFTENASKHLKLGEADIDAFPYISMPFNFSDMIEVYASRPNIIPGNPIRSIPALVSTSFIANKSLYNIGQLPNSEPGIYTVALIGTNKGDLPSTYKPRLFILKHNK